MQPQQLHLAVVFQDQIDDLSATLRTKPHSPHRAIWLRVVVRRTAPRREFQQIERAAIGEQQTFWQCLGLRHDLVVGDDPVHLPAETPIDDIAELGHTHLAAFLTGGKLVGSVQHSAMRGRIRSGELSDVPPPGQDLEHLAEIEGLGRAGHDPTPLAVELADLLGQQGAPDLPRSGRGREMLRNGLGGHAATVPAGAVKPFRAGRRCVRWPSPRSTAGRSRWVRQSSHRPETPAPPRPGPRPACAGRGTSRGVSRCGGASRAAERRAVRIADRAHLAAAFES